MQFMVGKRNKYLLALIILLFFICFLVMRKNGYAKEDVFVLAILEGALLLLFWKKQKWWAFWCSFFLFLFLGIDRGIPFMSKASFAATLFVAGGCFLLYRFYKTGWESYVTPGCFAIAFGLFGFVMELFYGGGNPCILLLFCLALVWHTSYAMKKRQKTIKKIWIESLAIFAFCVLLFFK